MAHVLRFAAYLSQIQIQVAKQNKRLSTLCLLQAELRHSGREQGAVESRARQDGRMDSSALVLLEFELPLPQMK